MRYLLDTCTFIWLCSKPDQLSPAAVSAANADDSRLVLSHASVMEICFKWTAGKIVLPSPPRMWVEQQIDTWELESLAIQADDAYRATELAQIHKDPFDRLLVSAALNQNLTILTPDDWIRRYPVSTLW
jgi:PIN domain nuclease of toxin-antitoxin system